MPEFGYYIPKQRTTSNRGPVPHSAKEHPIRIASRLSLASALAGGWFSAPAADFPVGVQAQPFYDTASIAFTAPVWLGAFPGIPGAMLVGEGAGGLHVLEPSGAGYRKWTFGAVPAAFISGNDGLLGVAFHPAFAANGRYFVCYNPARGSLVLEERRATEDRRADAGSVKTLLRLELGGPVHQGGDLHFGPDGFLYAGFGDGGNPNIYNTRSQDAGLLFGKMLRIDVDHQDPGLPYAIPADNPYQAAGGTVPRREIWAKGLRQPWRFSFDADGSLIVGDVGDWVQEEVDVIRKGGDYGWSRVEGLSCFNKDKETEPLAGCDTAALAPPAVVVPHLPISEGAIACIIGGYVFRGDEASPFYGAYLFGDFVSRKLYAARLGDGPATPPKVIGSIPDPVSTFGMDDRGNLYAAGYVNGIIYRLNHPGLIGKADALRPRPFRRPRPALARGRILAADFPGASSLALMALDGRVLRRYTASQLAEGVAPDLPCGLYLVQAGTAAGSVGAFLLTP
jgi:glucose/arabinose dehydrogenase